MELQPLTTPLNRTQATDANVMIRVGGVTVRSIAVS
jgi:hypothetical protein